MGHRRAIALVAVLLALYGSPAHAGEFVPDVMLDASQVLSADDAGVTDLLTPDSLSVRATDVLWPDGVVTYVETPLP